MAGPPETLVARYHHLATVAPPGELEVEVRFDRPDYLFVSQLVEKLSGPGFAVAQAQTLNTIQAPQDGQRSGSRAGGSKPGQAQSVWERKFLPDGTRANTYYRKERLAVSSGTLSFRKYRVALSREEPADQFPESSDMLFRVKNRLSFTATGAPPGAPLAGWRVDVTVVRELPYTSRASLPGAVETLFGLVGGKTTQTPRTLFQDLALEGDAVPLMTQLANREVYKYEVELEYVGAPPDLTVAGVEAAANAVLLLVNPDFFVAAQMRDELREAATFVTDSPSALHKYASGAWGVKQLAPQLALPTRGEYGEMYPPVGFFLTDKADGVHGLAMVRDGRAVILAPGLAGAPMLEAYIPDLGRPATSTALPAAAAGGTGFVAGDPAAAREATELAILDGEVLLVPPPPGEAGEPAEAGKPAPARVRFLAFDVIAVRGQGLAARPFEDRVQELPAAVAALSRFFPAEAKPFVHLASPAPADLKAQFEAMYRRPGRDYANDGLVLVEPGSGYSATKVWKWKPPEENSIDFLARRPPPRELGKFPLVERPGYDLYFLFVGVSTVRYRQHRLSLCPGYSEIFSGRSAAGAAVAAQRASDGYFPVPFQPSDQPWAYLYYHPTGGPDIEGRVVELALAGPAGADGTPAAAPLPATPAPAWKFFRVRADREAGAGTATQQSYGNDFRTAERNWLNIRDPLTFDMLWGGAGGSYFAKAKKGIYAAPTAFMSAAKAAVMSDFIAGSRWVVDLGVGKGQDLGRYFSNRIEALVAVDADQSALAELVRRKLAWGSSAATGRGRAAPPNTRIHVQRADFTQPHAAVAAAIRRFPRFPPEGADALVCNLAAHYAFGTVGGMVNFVQLVGALVRPQGQAVFIVLDGARVLAKFAELKIGNGKSWDIVEGGVLKYSVRRLFAAAKLAAAGQKIGVLLPFSDGRLYEEYVTNVDALAKEFGRRGFRLVDRRNLWEKYGGGQLSKHLQASITAGDVEWLQLFVALRFTKK